jgi:Flp pilus assembly protein TadG
MEALTVKRRSPAVKQRASEAGQSLLELALLLPILCLLVVGIVDLGRAAAVTIAVNNAATAGVEYGSQNGTTASNISGMQTAATNDTSGNYIPSGMSATATYGCLCDTQNQGVSCTYPLPAPSSCSTLLATCSGQPVECVQVVTGLSYGTLLNFPGVPTSYQANGHAVMRVRQ